MSALHIRYGRPEALPIDLLLSAIPSLPRVALDRLVERAIEQMDDQDGDPDFESDGDELDGSTAAEDEFWPHRQDNGWTIGCPVSDPGEDEDADQCLAADDGCAPIRHAGHVIWGHGEDEAHN